MQTPTLYEALQTAEKYVRWSAAENGTKKSQDDHRMVKNALEYHEQDGFREDSKADGRLLEEGRLFEPQAVRHALAVMVLTPHIREYLANRDPKALEQARKALGLQ